MTKDELDELKLHLRIISINIEASVSQLSDTRKRLKRAQAIVRKEWFRQTFTLIDKKDVK